MNIFCKPLKIKVFGIQSLATSNDLPFVSVNDIVRITILPGQQISLHASSRVLMPVQDKPPHEGVGLLHVLVSFLIPPPHVLLHGPGFHELQPPSTTEQSK